MRHSVFVKFIAIFLCAASLLGIAGTAAGLFAVTELGLRSRTLEEAYQEATENNVQYLAEELVIRHASRELGGADDRLINDYYGTYWLQDNFDFGQIGYRILDADGNLLTEEPMAGDYSGLTPFTAEVSGARYLNVLNVMTLDEYNEIHRQSQETIPVTAPTDVQTVYNAVPEDGCEIGYIQAIYQDAHYCDYGNESDVLGTLSYFTSNQMKFQFHNFVSSPSAQTMLDDFASGLPQNLLFMDMEGRLVFEISDPRGVVEEFSRSPGSNYFLLWPMDSDTVMLPDSSIYDAIAPEGQYVSRITVTYADGWSESAGGAPDIGFLGYDEEGFVVFTANSAGILEYRGEPVTYISFHDTQDNLVYEASDPESVGRFDMEGSNLVFRSNASTGSDTPPADTEEGIYVYDDVPPGGYEVCSMELWLQDGSTMLTIENDEDSLGHVDHDSSGNIVFQARNWKDFIFSKPARVLYILMTDQEGRVLYEAHDAVAPIGSGSPIGVFAYNEEGKLVFCRSTAAAASAAAEILPSETAPEATDEPVPAPTETGEESVPAATEEESIPASTEEDATEPTMTQETEEPSMAAEETLPPETLESTQSATSSEQVTEPAMAEETVEPTTPASTDPYDIALAQDTLRVYGYYDGVLREEMIVEYTYETAPTCTVEIVMAPGALRNRSEWVLMEIVYRFQQYLIPGLIVSLLLFAVTGVSLCCSAGRRPGTTEIRAGGLNRLPLDLYLCIAGFGIALCAVGFVEGSEYLLRQDIQIGILFGVLCAFAICLLGVAFLFAFAAQVKTPGLYWMRNSICGRSLKLLVWLWHKFIALCAWLWDKYDSVIEPLLIRTFKALWKLTKFFCIQFKKGFLWICRILIAGWEWLGQRLRRFFSMLPLTWQFLLTGFILVFWLYVMMRTYKVGYILLGFGIFFGVILYAASAFGILLENAKRMRKGDLDSKVDDRLLIGCFRDFAEELNGLADVAVVAAQKQLKSERMKTELITNVSHDIKTPLTSIINYVDLMEKPHSPEEQQAYLEVLSRQSQRLKKLIDDLMEMSKASTGNMAVDITEVNAAEAINQALGEFADKLDKAQLIPVFRQPETDIHMMADGRLVWRVLSNLLSNAVKYAMPGTRLYIDLMELEGKVVLSLKNISRDPLNVSVDELLERFVRGDAARNTEGSGLGLNIAQSLMELQKGRLELLVDGDLFKVTLIFPGA